MRLSFMKLPRYRIYDPAPIYYDPNKEKLEEIVANAKQELGLLEEEEKGKVGSNIRAKFARSKRQNQAAANYDGRRKANIRLLIIGAVLLVLFYFGFSKCMELAMLIVN